MSLSKFRNPLSIMVLGCLVGLAGCQTNYGADIHNQTSTPVFAQIMVKANDRNQPAVVGASRRLGPGDRGSVGPVRGAVKPGSAYLIVDSLPNPSKPASADLLPGTAFVTVTNADDGSLRITEKP
jgi:hypothetical protein